MQTLVIVGISGDLAKRKLLPALRALKRAGVLPLDRIVGTTRRELAVDALLIPDDPLRDMLEVCRLEDVQGIKDGIFYLAVPPGTAPAVAKELAARNSGILVLEKPFGHDASSAKEEALEISKIFSDDRVYRVSHYLAKPLGGRLSMLTNHHVDRIEVVASESLGLEGRAAYYETSGALRDFGNHLFSLLSFALGAQDGAARAALLKDLSVVHAAHGQYQGYEAELGTSSSTDTLIILELRNQSMPGVPIMLATGKALARKETCVAVVEDGHSKTVCELPQDTDAYERVLESLFARDRRMFLEMPEIMESWRLIDAARALMAPAPLRYERGTTVESLMRHLGW